jgi:hypothetical protein
VSNEAQTILEKGDKFRDHIVSMLAAAGFSALAA